MSIDSCTCNYSQTLDPQDRCASCLELQARFDASELPALIAEASASPTVRRARPKRRTE